VFTDMRHNYAYTAQLALTHLGAPVAAEIAAHPSIYNPAPSKQLVLIAPPANKAPTTGRQTRTRRNSIGRRKPLLSPGPSITPNKRAAATTCIALAANSALPTWKRASPSTSAMSGSLHCYAGVSLVYREKPMSYFVATATRPVACTPVTIAGDIARCKRRPVRSSAAYPAPETGAPTDVPYGALLRDTLAALRADREHIAGCKPCCCPAP
jgi:hypothetical protein